MAGDHCFGLVSLLITFFCLCGTVISFKDGAPFDMCKYKGNAFHTSAFNDRYVSWIQPRNESNPYKLTVDKLSYREYVERIINGKVMATSDMLKVTLSVKPGYKEKNFKGFYIKAIPFDRAERDPRAYGTFALVNDNGRFVVKNKDAETVLCYVLHWYSDVFPIGGVSHINDHNKTEVTVYWFPPKSCNIGKVRFEATVVYNYSVYWSDVQSEVIEPEAFGIHTYPACEYYRDPMGYYMKIKKRLRKKKLKNKRKNKQKAKKNNRKKQRAKKNKKNVKKRISGSDVKA